MFLKQIGCTSENEILTNLWKDRGSENKERIKVKKVTSSIQEFRKSKNCRNKF